MQNGVKTTKGEEEALRREKRKKSLRKFNWTVWDQEEIFKETWNTPSSQYLFNCRFIDCIEKVGLIWFNAFYIRYNIFNIQCTKRKKNIQVQEIFKNTHRPESPVCHRQQMNKKSIRKKALWIVEPPGLPDSWNSFKSQKVQQETSSTPRGSFKYYLC